MLFSAIFQTVTTIMKLTPAVLCLLFVLYVNGKRYYLIPRFPTRDFVMEKSEALPKFVAPEEDLKQRATDRSESRSRGRVMIKVYRGPAEGDYAPHGYWVRQPADAY